MRVSFESKGDFDNVLAWLKGVGSKQPTAELQRIAEEGKRNLMMNTPRDTGATAQSWVYEISQNKDKFEIAWKNTAHPNLSVSMAKLIDLGHGTKNGGYVQPRPYIKRSMDSVFKSAGDKIAGAVFE